MLARVLLLLVNKRLSRGPNPRDLDDDFTVLCPAEVGRFRRLRVKGTGRISLELAFVPLLATAEVQRTGEDHDCTRLIGMPMRRVLPTGRELNARDEQAWLFWVAIQHYGLWRSREGPLELDILRQLENASLRALRMDQAERAKYESCDGKKYGAHCLLPL